MKTTRIVAVLCAVVLAISLCGCLGTPDAVLRAHHEQGEDMRTIVEAYAGQIARIEVSTPEQEAKRADLAEKLARVAERVFRSHQELGEYLSARGLFASDKEREDFVALIRELRIGAER